MNKKLGVTTLCLWFMVSACALGPWPEQYAEFRKIKVGMTEAEVRTALGEPLHEYTQKSAPSPYYVKGWTYKERRISNKVLIYIKAEPIAYIWIDGRGCVEDVFVGGS
jgi:hypothetical protein